MSCFEEKLINLVRERNFLYNAWSRNHKNNVKREEAWADIAADLDTPADKCKQRWKSLRDRYVRELKIMNDAATDSDVEQWEFFASLEFLNNSLVKKRSSQPTEEIPPQLSDEGIEVKKEIFFEESINESNPESSYECTAKRPRTTEFPAGEFFGNLSKLLAERFSTQQEQDENDLFMKMIAKKMKVLSETSKIRLQERIFQMVNKEVRSFLEKS